MSTYIVQLPGIDGDRSVTIGATTYAAHIECKSVMHAINMSFNSANSARTVATSNHGPIGLLHDYDKASPLIRAKAAAGNQLATATIHRLSLSGDTVAIAETISLTGVYIVRIDVDSYVNPGTATSGATDTVLETFWLEYDAITWDYKYKTTTVSRSWSTSSLSSG